MTTLAYITWDVTPVLFTLGGIEIRWYGLLFALGFFFAYTLLYDIYKREKVKIAQLDMLTVYFFVATVVGARLGHCLFYEWAYYRQHLLEIFKIWEGGLASHGAAIAIVIALIIYIRRYKVNMWWLFDRVAMVIPIAAAFVRFGNLANSEIYGKPTTLPWAFAFIHDKEANFINVAGQITQVVPRHPTQLYEALAYLLISAVLYIIYRKKKGDIGQGYFVGFFLIALFTARFVIEFSKEVQESFEKAWPIDMGQILSIPFILLGIGFVFFAWRKGKTASN
ncbi:MAG: prolipoprotein diacylglyceryl transferase [Bacteroidota bacterium]